LKQGVTSPDTEKNREDKKREDNREDASSSSSSSQFTKTAIAEYETNIGPIAPAQYDDITDMLAELEERGLQSWWSRAIKVTIDANVRKWSYLRSVLNNCIRDGTAPGEGKRKQTAQTSAARLGLEMFLAEGGD
jgi:DnaD/phage-associated family protein